MTPVTSVLAYAVVGERNAGVGAIEVTANDPHVSEKVAAVDEALADADAVVGAGTVLDEATAQSVIDAGAEFVLAPGVNPDVVENRRLDPGFDLYTHADSTG